METKLTEKSWNLVYTITGVRTGTLNYCKNVMASLYFRGRVRLYGIVSGEMYSRRLFSHGGLGITNLE